ncbi:MAG: hypothetical protein N2489_07445 [Clostridia bacterium]|nr:hypothetical protein [Clostridia bacterium]
MLKKFCVLLTTMLTLVCILAMSASVVNYGSSMYFSANKHVEYSRIIKLSDGSFLAAFSADDLTSIRFFKSTNNCSSFSAVSTFTDNSDSNLPNIGAQTIFEVTPGTILLAYNQFDNSTQSKGTKLKIWKSTNGGSTWTFLSQVENLTWNWEPEFCISSDGKLQLYYSYSGTTMDILAQAIIRRESSDNGNTWSSIATCVGQVGSANQNVGMPRICKKGSTYFMAFEYYDDSACVHTATSSDGKTWSAIGPAVKVPNDSTSFWMLSTPTISSDGTSLFCMGKSYMKYLWEAAPNNGKVCLRSTDNGNTWSEMDLPFQLQWIDGKGNYSPTLLPLSSSQIFLITNSENTGHEIRYGVGAITAAIVKVNDATKGTANEQFNFVGRWSSGWDGGSYNSDTHWSNTANSYYQMSFIGTQIKIFAKKGTDMGNMAVSIDGGTETVVDLYQSSTQKQQLLWTSPVLASGQHTIKVRVTGTKNNNSNNTYVNADFVEIIK